MEATTSEREPSGLGRSIASPKFTCSGCTRVGLPSTSANELFMFGKLSSARTSAYPIRCVKDTLPPRARARWLLMTIRLSTSSLAGTARTLVAVGTVSEAFMFLTTLAAAPRSGLRGGPPVSSPAAGRAAAGLAAGAAAGVAGAAGTCWEARSEARLTTVPSERASTGVAREAGGGGPGATAGGRGRGGGAAAAARAGVGPPPGGGGGGRRPPGGRGRGRGGG